MADKLCYDVDDLNEQSKAIAKIADTIEKEKKDLKKKLKELKGDWKSDASTAFFNKIDSSWDESVQNYVDLLRDLSDALASAAGYYEPLEEKYKNINLE